MTILLSGGGTGGHITPILAVARELKQLEPNCRIVYIGERGGKFAQLLEGQKDIDEVHNIYAGKLRRYYGESWLHKVFDIKTNILNLRDFFLLIIGTFQSIWLLAKIKPGIVFLKGGFVGVPVGFASVLRRTPFITHDSDILPGLANRIVSRWARIHATGMPANFYSYPKDSTVYTGVLISEAYKPITPTLQQTYRTELKLPPESQFLFVTGGSLGSLRLNEAMREIQKRLLEDYPNLYIVHQVGKGKQMPIDLPLELKQRLHLEEFLSDLHIYSGAADLIVTRAGATNLAEFGAQGKTCIVVPNPLLTGGHQLKNAEYLESKEAVITIPENAFKTDAVALNSAIRSLLDDPGKRQELGNKLQSITVTDAAEKLASLLMETVNRLSDVQEKATGPK